jgi:phage FluMu protein Com
MRGEISNEFTVWCAKCNEWYQESTRKKASAVEAFKVLGWRKTKWDGWICPKCKEVKGE